MSEVVYLRADVSQCMNDGARLLNDALECFLIAESSATSDIDKHIAHVLQNGAYTALALAEQLLGTYDHTIDDGL